jgi:PPM family protein phosphatase
MQEAKNTQRSVVRLGYDGRVHKLFRGPKAEERYENEARVLKYLEARQCPFVPQVLEEHPDRLELVTTNCGARVEQISDAKLESLFTDLVSYGVKHDDPYLRNVTYRPSDGRFCLIDFEFSTILDPIFVAEDTVSKVGAWLNHSIAWSALTDRGRFRPNNEDSFLAAMLDRNGLSHLGRIGQRNVDNEEFIFAVSDGMGGENSGEFASKIAVQKLTTQLPRHFGANPRNVRSYCEGVLKELFESIHQELLLLGKHDSNCREMGATLTLVWLRSNRIYFAHIGDSRLYYLPAHKSLLQMSYDHSHVGWLRRKGEINERQAREHPRRSVLSQCLGAGHRYLDPQFGVIEVQSGDKIVLCTDGVNEGLWDRGIEELLESPASEWVDKALADRLVLSAVQESGRDNASCVAIEFQEAKLS